VNEADAPGESVPLEPAVWRHQESLHPQSGLSHDAVKEAFWHARPGHRSMRGADDWIEVDVDKLSAVVAKRAERATALCREHKEGDPEVNYDLGLVGKMERTTPQFNLRNVNRLIKEVDTEWIEWEAMSLGPSRRAYEQDLEEVRTHRHEPPVFASEFYSSNVNTALAAQFKKVFKTNDWEQWYGEDKKREVGAMWKYIPPDGKGIRTRPWPELLITAHTFWKGRLITEEY
jgi:hypothetical protein